jgi:hypothetical protein
VSEADLRGALYRYQQKQKTRNSLKGRTDSDRSVWIDNDEGLYDWWKKSKLSKREFIKQNRKEIDEAIDPVVDGTKLPHHLKYGD